MTLQETIKRFAKYVHPYTDRIQVLPPVALGALYEYNHAMAIKADICVDHVIPVNQVHPPTGHWGHMRLHITGEPGGPIRLTPLDNVENLWWTKAGK